MKKRISLFLVLSLLISCVPAAAQTAVSETENQLALIQNEYQKQMRNLELEKRNKLMKLRKQYEESLNLIDLQLNDADRMIVSAYEPKLRIATPTQAVVVRQEMNEKLRQAKKERVKFSQRLKQRYESAKSDLGNLTDQIKKSLTDKYTASTKSVKRFGSTAAESGISALATFGSLVGPLMGKSILQVEKTFNGIRKKFGEVLSSLGVVTTSTVATAKRGYQFVRGGLQQFGSAVKSRVASLGAAIGSKLVIIGETISGVKNQFTSQIKSLVTDTKALNTQALSYGSREMPKLDRENMLRGLGKVGKMIALMTILRPIPVLSYQVASRSAIGNNFIERAKRKLMTPLHKVAAAWKHFTTKMNCIGNPACTPEQRMQAVKLLQKVYLSIVALQVIAITGGILIAIANEQMNKARNEAQQQRERAQSMGENEIEITQEELVPPSKMPREDGQTVGRVIKIQERMNQPLSESADLMSTSSSAEKKLPRLKRNMSSPVFDRKVKENSLDISAPAA